ncbi:MAG: aminoacyl-tRNA hydrolase [Acholeplasmatales bacterium]|nr:aminoacyl-tRNA hydrolase [Acholeplasmatales bacterium]
MKLIVGLGNPGKQYEGTRHNAGFMCIDEVAKYYNCEFKLETKLKGMVAKVNVNGNKAILLKPMTYMNLSGEALVQTAQFYKIDFENIIVIADDLDSRCGRVRLRADGSAGGHNGLKNIILKTGRQDFKRIKIGIDRSSVIPVIDWVLTKFTKDELPLINEAVATGSKACIDFIEGKTFYQVSSLYSSK